MHFLALRERDFLQLPIHPRPYGDGIEGLDCAEPIKKDRHVLLSHRARHDRHWESAWTGPTGHWSSRAGRRRSVRPPPESPGRQHQDQDEHEPDRTSTAVLGFGLWFRLGERFRGGPR